MIFNIYLYKDRNIHVCMYTLMYLSLRDVYNCMYRYMCMHVHMCVCRCVYAYTYVCVCIPALFAKRP